MDNLTDAAVPGANSPKPARRRPAAQQIVDRDCGAVGKYRVRIIRTSEKPDAPRTLDVREYVRGSNYEGYTRKGIRLGAAEARGLKAILEEVVALL